jgi:hypothetical protein
MGNNAWCKYEGKWLQFIKDTKMAELDCAGQSRFDSRDLAMITQYFESEGKRYATRSMSALIREAVKELAQRVLDEGAVEPIEYNEDAYELLVSYGIVLRNNRDTRRISFQQRLERQSIHDQGDRIITARTKREYTKEEQEAVWNDPANKEAAEQFIARQKAKEAWTKTQADYKERIENGQNEIDTKDTEIPDFSDLTKTEEKE